jgi:flagellin-like protein
LREKDRAVSPIVTVLILMAIAISIGALVYNFTMNYATTSSRMASIQIASANLIKTSTITLLSIEAVNTGTEPLNVGVYTDAVRNGLQALGDVTVPCCSEAKGLIIYAVVELPPGTYDFTWGADDRANVFVRGPGLSGWTPLGSWVWGPVSDSISLQGGTYEIAYVCVDYCWHGWVDFRANLPVSQIRWLITAYHARWPEGACWSQPWVDQLNEFFGSVQADPLHPGSWHPGTYHITGQYTCITSGNFDFNTSWTDGNSHNDSPTNQPVTAGANSAGIIIGLLNPGQSGSFIVPLDPGYAGNPDIVISRSYTITIVGFSIDGDVVCSDSTSISP